MSPFDYANVHSIGFLSKEVVNFALLRRCQKGFAVMRSVSVHDAALVFDDLFDGVCAENGQPVEITRENQPSVVMIGKQQYAAILEALDRSIPSDERS